MKILHFRTSENNIGSVNNILTKYIKKSNDENNTLKSKWNRKLVD